MEFIRYEKSHKPIIYEIYKYLKVNCKGYENKQTSCEIMNYFGIEDNKQFRGYIEEIRQSDILQKFVCSKAGSKDAGYWIATCQNDVSMTLEHLLLRAMEMLKTYAILRRKSRLNNQRRLKLSKYEKDVYESLMVE